MKRMQKLTAVIAMAGFLGMGVPVVAAPQEHESRTATPYYHDGQHGNPFTRGNQRRFGQDDRGDRRAPAPMYYTAPAYGGPVYGYGYYDHPTHNGRAAAIIAGSTAAGALIGAATDHGQGAVIGAILGGITGVAINTEANHHDRDHSRY
jgi:hypothetical protein